MRNKLMLLVVVVLVIAMLPVGVFAGKPAELDLKVYNRTETPVSVQLTDANGALSWLEIPVGVSSVTLTEGIYEYYVVTSCGTLGGRWNVNVVKDLFIKCEENAAVPEVSLKKQCWEGTWWYDVNGESYFDRWFVPSDWVNIGDEPLPLYYDYDLGRWVYGIVDLAYLGDGCWPSGTAGNPKDKFDQHPYHVSRLSLLHQPETSTVFQAEIL